MFLFLLIDSYSYKYMHYINFTSIYLHVLGHYVSLRGFPWGKEESAKIVFLNGSDNFKLDMKIKGKDNIKIGDKTYPCWKVQIGMSGVMGALFPKSYYWFYEKSPHYLIRADSSGMPGSPKTILEIQSYESN
jgi:hypothetical protein